MQLGRATDSLRRKSAPCTAFTLASKEESGDRRKPITSSTTGFRPGTRPLWAIAARLVGSRNQRLATSSQSALARTASTEARASPRPDRASSTRRRTPAGLLSAKRPYLHPKEPAHHQTWDEEDEGNRKQGDHANPEAQVCVRAGWGASRRRKHEQGKRRHEREDCTEYGHI